MKFLYSSKGPGGKNFTSEMFIPFVNLFGNFLEKQTASPRSHTGERTVQQIGLRQTHTICLRKLPDNSDLVKKLYMIKIYFAS